MVVPCGAYSWCTIPRESRKRSAWPWSGWTTPLCVRCSWHRPRKPVGSCEWFSLGYRQAFGRIWCNIAAQAVPSFRNNWQSDERSLHFLTHRPTVTNWRFLLTGKNSGMHMNVPYTTQLKDASQSSFVYAGKIKVRYFLNNSGHYPLSLETGSSCTYWAQLSRFHLKTKTESSLRNVVF
jgi:hypothetical protein